LQTIKELKLSGFKEKRFKEIKSPNLDYVQIIYQDGPRYPTQFLSGAITWEPEKWQAYKNELARKSYQRAEFIIQEAGFSKEFLEDARENNIYLQTLLEYQGLIEFSSYREKLQERLKGDTRYLSENYVPQRLDQRKVVDNIWNQLNHPDDSTKPWFALDAIRSWVKEPNGQLILLLAEFGAGKSFLIRQVAEQFQDDPVITPVLIELSQLENGQIFEELIAQHLTRAKVANPNVESFNYMLKEGHILLLFDGFDELLSRVTYQRATVHLNTILKAAQGKAKVIVTSRREHFIDDKQVLTALGERYRQVGNRMYSIQRFNDDDILLYLTKRLKTKTQAQKRFGLITEIKDLLGLSQNPRMLGFISDLDEDELEEAKNEEGEITEASLYRTIIQKWLEHEYNRLDKPGSPPPMSIKDRWKVLDHVACVMWQQPEQKLSLDLLQDKIQTELKSIDTANLGAEVIAHQTGSATLLIRDEQGLFSFAHRSILEYLVADSIANALNNDGSHQALEQSQVSALMARFLLRLAEPEKVNEWVQKIQIDAQSTTMMITNSQVLGQRLEEIGYPSEATQQETIEKDYSHRDLSGQTFISDLKKAKFVGANLQEAQFVGVNLEGADFSESNLQHANLSNTNLNGVSFKDANLAFAKLIGSSLDVEALELAKSSFGSARDLSLLKSQYDHDFDEINSVAWHPEQPTLVALGSSTGELSLLDVEKGQPICSWLAHQHSVYSVAFSPDGKQLLSGSADNTLKLWDSNSGQLLKTLEGHQHSVLSVAFSPDGKQLLSGSDDNTLKLWDSNSNRLLFSLCSLANQSWVAFTPTNHFKLSNNYLGGFWHSINLCRFEPGELDALLPEEQKLHLSEDHVFR